MGSCTYKTDLAPLLENPTVTFGTENEGTPELISMSMNDLDRLMTVQAVIDGHLTGARAAEHLGITDRQLRRLLERWSSKRSCSPRAS